MMERRRTCVPVRGSLIRTLLSMPERWRKTCWSRYAAHDSSAGCISLPSTRICAAPNDDNQSEHIETDGGTLIASAWKCVHHGMCSCQTR